MHAQYISLIINCIRDQNYWDNQCVIRRNATTNVQIIYSCQLLSKKGVRWDSTSAIYPLKEACDSGEI